MLYVVGESAVRFWRSGGEERQPMGWIKRLPAGKSALRIDTELLARLGCGGAPYHLAADCRGWCPGAQTRATVRWHQTAGTWGDGAFSRVADEVAVATPALCFLQIAHRLSLAEAIWLGYELCAGSAVDDRRLLGSRNGPVVTAGDIAAFCQRNSHRDGSVVARQALEYVLDNAASPLEVAAAMLLTMPRKLGGYGLNGAVLNQPVSIGNGLAAAGGLAWGGVELRPDIAWPESRVAVEYDSDSFHALGPAITRDALRRNALMAAGWTVITLTWNQVKSGAAMDLFAEQVRRALGRRKPHYRIPEGEARKRELRETVLRLALGRDDVLERLGR